MKIAFVVVVTVLLMGGLLLPNYATARGGGRRSKKACRDSIDGCRRGRVKRPKVTTTPASSTDHQMRTNFITCAPCSKMSCLHDPATLTCSGGVVPGFCGCCHYCAKLEGESCGGRNMYLGKCGDNLTCEPIAPPTRRSVLEVFDIDRSVSLPSSETANWRGTCRPADRVVQPTQDPTSTCRSECTPAFCFSQPNAICSARNSAVEWHSCQGVCQHTSCKACFVSPTPKCTSCDSNDYKCMRSFGKCVKAKSTCKKKKFPCKRRKNWRSEDSLKCWVPGC